MKVLFVDMHREGRSPSQRFRYEQYLEFFRSHGIHCEHSYLLSSEDDKVFYRPGNYFKKFLILIKSILKRLNDVKKANKDVDIIFIQREAFMLGTTYFERQFAKSKAKIIFDFDDSIWLTQVSNSSAPNKNLAWLKNPDKTKEIIAISDLILAGNEYLANYARAFNANIEIVPTTINTDEYKPRESSNYEVDKVCIGWSGSKTTIDHFEEAIPVLTEIKKKYGDRVTFMIIGDGDYTNEQLVINGLPWIRETEIEDLAKIDIGIMPLPDDEWSKGKCGLKGLQYMALGIPTLMSPVGVNSSIIKDGVNGYLPKNQNEWVNRISKLIEDRELRNQIGKNGRKTVEEGYSVLSQQNNYLKLLKRWS